MIVSHRHRFVFLKTRKTAGTSVEIALSRICGPDDVITPLIDADEEMRQANGGLGAQNNGTPPLVVPVSSHSSARRVRRALGGEHWGDYFKFAIERNPWDVAVSHYWWHHRNRPEGRRPEFSRFLSRDFIENLAAKNASNYRIQNEVVVDRVLRYENLSAELATIWQELGLPESPELPHAKSGTRPKTTADYRTMYDDAGRERVAEVFADVIDLMGYEF